MRELFDDPGLTEEALEEACTGGPGEKEREELYVPRDVTPKALRGRGVQIVRLFTGWRENAYSGRRETVKCYRWRVRVPWGATGWRAVGTCGRLKQAVELAWRWSE